MKRVLLPMLALVIVSITGCKNQKPTMDTNNPFFTEYTTPFQVPPFDKIDTSHYLPAFIEGISQHDQEIAAITENTADPDFENTILAFDKSGKLLNRVSYVFYNMVSDSSFSLSLSILAILPVASFTFDTVLLRSLRNSGLSV